jgi:hypothetical protein
MGSIIKEKVIPSSAENFWQWLQFILFGAGHFNKVIIKRALSQV